eukprot:jgi/Orpsp1_1/1187087/evm.model.d7180000055319.1
MKIAVEILSLVSLLKIIIPDILFELMVHIFLIQSNLILVLLSKIGKLKDTLVFLHQFK